MKLLFVITGLGMGGAENVVVTLADGMAAKGHEILIVYLTGDAIVTPKNPQIKIVGLGMASAKEFLNAFLKLRKIISEFQPDVIHSHMVHANLLARLVRLTIKIPKLVCTAHSTYEGGRLRMMAYRLTDALADISTNVSKMAVVEFEKLGAVPLGRMIPVLNGIDHRKFSPNDSAREASRKKYCQENEKVFIAIGRLFEAKDYPNLLQAFTQVAQQHKDVKLWIVGDGPLRSNLENLASELGIAKNVLFLGMRHDIAELLNGADVFVLSSAWEGFGLVVAEAMAAEKIVVATDSGGVKEVVGECGFLVPVGNPPALAQAMSDALALPDEKRQSLVRQGSGRVADNYSLDKIIDTWLEIYYSTYDD